MNIPRKIHRDAQAVHEMSW